MDFNISYRMIRSHIESRFPGEHPYRAAVREYLTSTCEEFVNRGLADPKFVSELTYGSDQKFWASVSEALIAAHLRDKEFGERDGPGKGPDFLVMDGSRRVWIEVVCPGPGNLPPDWLHPPSNSVISFPHEEILLRWTSAIKAKAEALIGSIDGKREGYLRSGQVARDDAYVIAVNGCQLRHGPFSTLFGISQLPFAAEAVFPVGPYQLWLDRESLEVVERGHQHRPHVRKENGAKVPACTFLDPRFESVSAIWAVDLDGGSTIGNQESTAVVHNPNATNPVRLGFLPADYEYLATNRGDEYLLTKVSTRGAG